MIVKLVGDHDTEEDARALDVAAETLAHRRRVKNAAGGLTVGAGGRGTVHDSMDDIEDIDSGENLYILGHSDGKEIAGMDPFAMAYDLYVRLPDPYSAKIKFMSCHTGEDVIDTIKGRVSYAHEVARYLAAFDKDSKFFAVSVHGRLGLSIANPVSGVPGLYPDAEAHALFQSLIKAFDETHGKSLLKMQEAVKTALVYIPLDWSEEELQNAEDDLRDRWFGREERRQAALGFMEAAGVVFGKSTGIAYLVAEEPELLIRRKRIDSAGVDAQLELLS